MKMSALLLASFFTPIIAGAQPSVKAQSSREHDVLEAERLGCLAYQSHDVRVYANSSRTTTR
jgi:hypothetical protein